MDNASTDPTIPSALPVVAITPSEDTPVLTKSEIALKKREDSLNTAFNKKDSTARKELCERIVRLVDAKRKVRDRYGGIVGVEDDIPSQLKAVELGLKVIGDLVEVKTEVNVDASSRMLQVTTAEREELELLRSRIHEVKRDG